MKKSLYAILLLGFVYNIQAHQSFDFVVSFYLRKYPELSKPTTEDFSHATQSPGSISQKILENFNSNFSGIFVTYYGYLTISDLSGLVRLPLHGKKTSFNMLVTPLIKPMFMIGLTIHHWEIAPKQPAELYSIERKQDPTTLLYYWKTKKANIPANNIVDLNTITIFADPHDIYIPEGITLTTDNPQLVLPTVYVRKNNTIIPTLLVLNIRQFFGSLIDEYKKQNETYYSSLLTTPGQ